MMSRNFNTLLPILAPKDFKNTWLDLSTEEYRALPAANFSSLKHMLRSPANYLYHLESPPDPTDAMKFGTIAHMALLEGEKFRSLYVVEPIFEGLTKKGEITTSKNCTEVKEKMEEWYRNLLPGAMVITQEELDSLNGIVNSLLANDKILAAIKNGIPEAKGTWVDPDTGIVCKFAADLWMPSQKYLLDVKTTSISTEWEVFRKSVERLDYDMQMAFYHDGIEAITGQAPDLCGWVPVDTKRANEIELHLVYELYLTVGRYKYKKCLKKLKKCLESGAFPQKQHESDFQMPEPSGWYKSNYEGMMYE